MDSVIPLGIVIYIVASVLGAVLKSINSSKGPVSGGSKPQWGSIPSAPLDQAEQSVESQTYEIVNEVVEPMDLDESNPPDLVIDESQTRRSYSSMDWDEDEIEGQLLGMKSRPNSKQVGFGNYGCSRETMRRGLILSEIWRLPRSKRRWPDR